MGLRKPHDAQQIGVSGLTDGQPQHRHDQIASLPEGIRGFFDVKEEHLEDVRVKEKELLEAFGIRQPFLEDRDAR